MDGFRFDWDIVAGSDKVKQMSNQENDGKNQTHTDIFVLKGVALGKATVKVRLREPGYEQLQE
jgi:hypothetical protein